MKMVWQMHTGLGIAGESLIKQLENIRVEE